MEQYINKERCSNIELLRIISIILIIMGHMIGQSGAFNELSIGTQVIVSLMGSASRIAVNLFLIIGVWFMVDSDFKSTRIIGLYSELFFYSILITIAMLFVNLFLGGGYTLHLKDVIRGMMPLLGRPLWFASAYICLIALSPYLKMIFKLKVQSLAKLVILLFIMICVISSLPDRQTGYVVDSLYFIFMYLFIGFYKKEINMYIKRKQAYLLGIAGIMLYVMLVICKNLKYIYGSYFITEVCYIFGTQYLEDIKTIPNVFCSFGIFVLFLNIDIGRNTRINWIAKPVFSIYIIHQVPAFIPFLWNNICKCKLWPQTNYIIFYCIAATALIYGSGMFVDNLRIRYIEKMWMNSRLYRKLCGWVEKIYSDVYLWERGIETYGEGRKTTDS